MPAPLPAGNDGKGSWRRSEQGGEPAAVMVERAGRRTGDDGSERRCEHDGELRAVMANGGLSLATMERRGSRACGWRERAAVRSAEEMDLEREQMGRKREERGEKVNMVIFFFW